MFANPDNTNAESITVTPSHNRPKRSTARMHAARVARVTDSAQRRHHRAAAKLAHQHRTAAGGNSTTPARARSSDLTIKYGMGDCPPYNDHVDFVQDPYNRKMYMIGGIRPGEDEHAASTSDFYCCNMVDMSWIDLTPLLRRRVNPHDPCCKERILQELPRLRSPGCMLLRLEGTSYIAIFGGYDCDSREATSDILLIEPDKKEWWPLTFQGNGVNPRINPTVVAINGTIYVFGGYRRYNANQRPSGLYHSFSVAERGGDGNWRWLTRDTPYSSSVPIGHAFQEACPVYNGTKILLTPGRFATDEPIAFTQDNCFFYHTTNKRFQPATTDITGTFPPPIRFYSIFSPTVMHPLGGSQNNAVLPISAHSTPLTPYSVIICAYVDVPNTEDVAPEIWQLYLSPEERIECLNIKQKIWDLCANFQGSVYVDGRVRILGSDSEFEPGDKDYEDAKWNTYLDIPLKR